MNALLLCPTETAGLAVFPKDRLCPTMPLLGYSLLEYWLSHLARMKARRVLVVASDGCDPIEALVQDGSRWGVEAQVKRDSIGLTPGEALGKYASELGASPEDILLNTVDHFPGLEQRLFDDPRGFFEALMSWMPSAAMPDRVGIRELREGIWVGVNSNVSPQAHLVPPCWVGARVVVGPGAVLGPRTIVEDGCVIESSAEVRGSWVGEQTLVGELTRLENALAWGSHLLDLNTGTMTIVPDHFVLCALAPPPRSQRHPWLAPIPDKPRHKPGSTSLTWKGLIPGKEAGT